MTAPDVEALIARIAARQSGVVTREQLLRRGLSPKAIKHRIAAGRLFVIHRGVYAVGHEALSDGGRVIAGLLAAGPGAAASHRAAAALDGLLPSVPEVVDVTVLGRARRSRNGLIIHETTRPFEVRRREGIPRTAPLRTLADLEATRPREEVERITQEALARRLVRPDELRGGRTATRSVLERRFLAIIRRAGLPEPRVGHLVGRHLVDFAWPDHGVAVETDGYATHGGRAAFERDRSRDAALRIAGYAVLRFSWRQIAREPLTVVAALAAALSPGSPARAPAPAGTRRAGARPPSGRR